MKPSRVAVSLICITLVCLALLFAGRGQVFAAGQILSYGMSPEVGTSNSVYEYWVVFADDPPPPTEPKHPLSVTLYVDGDPVKTIFEAETPYYHDPGSIRTGIKYWFHVTSGLDMAGPSGFRPSYSVYYNQDPDDSWKRVIRYIPSDHGRGLKANSDGTPKSNHRWAIYTYWQGPPDANGILPEPTLLIASGSGPTVHDSFIGSFGGTTIDRYGGLHGDRDSLYSFSWGYPFHVYCDPLSVEPYHVQFPDEGSSTSMYTFRVHYYHEDGLKPGNWLRWWQDWWSVTDYESGVMLYLRNLDKPNDPYWGVFTGHHMYKENPSAPAGDADYILRVGPIGSTIIRTSLDHWLTTWAWTSSTNHYYEALPPGRYEYFFACSDDDYSVLDRDKFFLYMDDQARIRQNPDVWSSVPTPLPPNDWNFGGNGLNWIVAQHADPVRPFWTGSFGYVDKRTYTPGAWAGGYPYDSWQGSSLSPSRINITPTPIQYHAYTYPEVDPGLFQVGPFNYGLDGGARFLGTLSPYKRAVVPIVPAQAWGIFRLWSETAGGTEQDQFTFQVNYWQSHGVAPSYVRLYVSNVQLNDYNSWNPDTSVFNGTYDMLPALGYTPTSDDYQTGVPFEVRLSGGQLGRGPHCYYFEAADQQWVDNRYPYGGLVVDARVVRYPRRPDTIKYNNVTFYDGLLPGKSPDADVDVGVPVQNDVINGPYINTRPQLVSVIDSAGLVFPSVWPPHAVAGTEFLFRVRYRDADNQRPYTPLLIIETDDAGNTFTASMVRSPDSSVPGNSAAQFSDPNGVAYEFRTSSAPGLRLQPGNRRFKFDFMDDWGRQNVQDDRIAGEHIPETQRGWAGGFTVSGNRAPALRSGNVTSSDGTSNEATVWNYRVIYADADNNPPAYILVFIGRQDTSGAQIVWDSGNALHPSIANDNVYSDGREYIFSTRLNGSNSQPIKYYSCYVASDGIEPAEYNATTSPSSGMIWKNFETLTPVGGGGTIYGTAHFPVVTDVPPSTGLLFPTNYSGPVVYDGSGAQQSQGGTYNINNVTGVLTFTLLPIPPVIAKYWFGTAPDPLTGPAAVTGNHPPVLSDGKVIPLSGSSSDSFTYSVTYQDLDGQAPLYVNAVVDDVRHTMIAVRGSTTYKTGVQYECQTVLTTGSHQFYFEATDGAALALFDNDMSNTTVDPIPGPYINDRPTFTGAQITPSGATPIDAGQPVTYTITYTDNDGDAPMSGYPVVYVDNVSETDWNGTVGAVGEDFIGDPYQTGWQIHQFRGMPVEVTLASTSQRIIYKIADSTSSSDPLYPNRLYLIASSLPDTVVLGSQFTIGILTMYKQDPADQIYTDGVAYEAKVPSLGAGNHRAHFKAVVDEQRMPGVFQQYTVRAPVTGDLLGPTVIERAPATNRAPTLTNGGVSPRTGTAGTAFRFAVTYTDLDGDSPFLPHDQTKGYIRMNIEESPGVWKTYDLNTDLDAPNYTVGVVFSYILSGLSLGPHNFYFEASDGWVSVRDPAAPPAMHTVYVSRPPVLVEGAVIPTSGNTGRVYEYKVKYRDPDGDPPQFIRLIIDNGTPIEIGVPMPGADYITGVVYSYPLLKGTLTEALHTFYFEASDGNGYAWYDQDVRDLENAHDPLPRKNSTTSSPPSPIRPIDGPSVHSNTAPTLAGGIVIPTTGFDLETYVYTVTYTDQDGDEPEYVECYIDDPDPTNPNQARAFRMTKNPSQNDYVIGVNYTLSKVGFTAGSHTFYFRTSDWLATASFPTTGTMSGPTVATRSGATITLTAPASITIGDSATLTGTVTGYGGVPLASIPIQIRIVRPDSVTISPQPTVTTSASGQFTYPSGAMPWKPSLTGTWKVQASWVGNSQYLVSTSPERTMAVLGPNYTVSGLDMISVPIQPISTFPDGVLGPVPPFALAKWLPTTTSYKLYSLLTGIRTDYDFPGIAPGQGYWIKTLVPKTIAPTGSLVDPFSDYPVTLGVGWNQIGCPFTSEIAWSSLRVKRTLNGVTSEVNLATAAANGWIREYGWTYDPASGNYKLVDATRAGAERTMRPWRAYWVKAMMYCSIVIPGPNRGTRSASAPSFSTLAAEPESANASSAKWQVQILAKNGTLKDECNYLGASRSDDERMESPACFENYVDLYFTDAKGHAYASDLRRKVSSGTTWKFNVATDKPGEVELTWAGIEDVPNGYRLVLTDLDGKSMVMTPGGSYKFTAREGEMSRSFEAALEKP